MTEDFSVYTPEFYMLHHDDSHREAYTRIAMEMEYIFGTSTAIDAGCGTGQLMSNLKDLGWRIVGIESPMVKASLRSAIVDEPDYWMDLGETPLVHIPPERVVISLEVAEHIPAENAGQYVQNLCRWADEAVVFSAAFPGQGGTGHVNERPWPYWIKLFADQGFEWDVETSKALQARLKGRVGGCFWYERINILRRK